MAEILAIECIYRLAATGRSFQKGKGGGGGQFWMFDVQFSSIFATAAKQPAAFDEIDQTELCTVGSQIRHKGACRICSESLPLAH